MLLNWECCKLQERERNGTTGTNEVQLCGWIKPREQNHPRKSSKQFKTMLYLCTYVYMLVSLCIFLLHYWSLNTQNCMGEKKARTGHNNLRYLVLPLSLVWPSNWPLSNKKFSFLIYKMEGLHKIYEPTSL